MRVADCHSQNFWRGTCDKRQRRRGRGFGAFTSHRRYAGGQSDRLAMSWSSVNRSCARTEMSASGADAHRASVLSFVNRSSSQKDCELPPARGHRHKVATARCRGCGRARTNMIQPVTERCWLCTAALLGLARSAVLCLWPGVFLQVYP